MIPAEEGITPDEAVAAAAEETVLDEVEAVEAEPVQARAEEPAAADAAPVEQPAEAEAKAEPVPAPTVDEAAEDQADEPARKRRGRRGGRRRRREDELEAPAAEVEVPLYTGPTPADPFGGAYDIFDALERAEEERAAAPHANDTAPELIAEPVPEPPGAAEAPASEAFAQHATAEADTPAEPAPAEPALMLGGEDATSPEPARDAEIEERSELPEFAAPEFASSGPADIEADERERTPACIPVLVGADDAPVVPKRGWWRR